MYCVCLFRGMTDSSDQFRKIIMCYKRIGYNLNVMRQSACLVINPITVGGFAALFNCMPVERMSDPLGWPYVHIVICLFVFFIIISLFGFKSGIWLLIAPVPVHCFSITFK